MFEEPIYIRDMQDKIAEAESNELIPKGTVLNVIAKEAERRANKGGTGQYVRFDMRVTSDGDFHGTEFPLFVNYENDNKQTERIAQKMLVSMADALDIEVLNTPEDLCGQELEAVIGINKARADFSASNTIIKFQKLGTSKVEDTPF